MRGRVPNAERLGFYSLREHDLRFHKSGRDGSGKCDAFYTGDRNNRVEGTVFEINANGKKALDRAEGLGNGYEEKIVNVVCPAGKAVEAITYYATKIDGTLKPYSWYLNHVIVGARESQLPGDYIEKIQSIESITDPDIDRDAVQREIHS